MSPSPQLLLSHEKKGHTVLVSYAVIGIVVMNITNNPLKLVVSNFFITLSILFSGSLLAVDFSWNENEPEVVFSIGFVNDGVCGLANGCSMRVFTEDGSAKAGVDFRAIDTTLNWREGEGGFISFTIPLIDNSIRDGDKSFFLHGENIQGFSNDLLFEFGIIDDEPELLPGTLGFESASITVSESDGTAVLTVTRSGGSDGRVSVNFSTGSDDDSAQAGIDYTENSGTLTWNDGDSAAKQIRINILGDSLKEGDESFSVQLSGPSGDAILGNQSRAIVSIKDSTNNGTLSFRSPSLSAAEGAGAVQFQVQRLGGSDGAVSVNYQIGNTSDSATRGDDYNSNSVSGTLNWAAGDSADKNIELIVLSDALTEGDETVSIVLSTAEGGAILGQNSSATLTILDNLISEDFSPALNIVSGDQQTGFAGTTLDPFVLQVKDGETLLPGATVNWSVSPSSSGRLVNGVTTQSNDSAQASNSLEILKSGIITVTAVFDTTSAGSLQSRADDDPTTVVFTVNAGFQGSPELDANQRSVGKSMDSACESLDASSETLNAAEQDLQNTCNTLENASAAEIRAGVARLNPEEAFAIGTATMDTSNIQVTNVQSRINAIRLGTGGLDLASLNLNVYGQEIPGYVMGTIGQQMSGGSAGEDEPGRLGVFVNGSISYGTLDETDSEMGLDFDSRGITLGADYRVSDNWVFGGALGLVSHSGDYTSESGSIDLSGTSLSAFMTWYDKDDAYFDAIISIGQNDFDIRRRINLPGQADQFANSSPSATEVSLSIGGGLEYYQDEWTFGPYGRLSFAQARVDAYREKASDPDAPGTGSVLLVDDQSMDSTSLALGGNVAKNISTRSAVWIPQLRLELEHSLSDKNRTLEASFVHDPTATSFEIESEDVDTDYMNLGAGVSAVFKNGKSGYLFYETRIGQDRLSQNWIKGGFRLDF